MPMSWQLGRSTFLAPNARTERPFADKDRRIEKVNRSRPAEQRAGRRDEGDCVAAAGLDRPAGISFHSGVGCLG